MLLVFLTSCRSAQQILKTVPALLVYSVRWTIRFWDCTGLPPKSMQKALLEEVNTTQNALPPDFECVLSLFANGTPVTPAAVKALDKCFQETAKRAKKIDKQMMKHKFVVLSAKHACNHRLCAVGLTSEWSRAKPVGTAW